MTKLFRRRRDRNNNNNNASATNSPEVPTAIAIRPGAGPPNGFNNNNPNNNPNNNGIPVARATPLFPRSGGRAPPAMTCHTCARPISRNERHIHTSRAASGERRYHRGCFSCLHCEAPIDPQTQSFCYAKVPKEGSAHGSSSGAGGGGGTGGNNNNNAAAANTNTSNGGVEQAPGDDEHPFHRECFAQHFGWMCVVCEKPLPMVTKFINPNDDDNNNNATTNSNTATNNGDNNNNNAPPNTISNGNGNQTRPATAGGLGGPGAKKSTKVEFLKHPFFDKERMCPHHAGPIAEQIQRQYQQQDGNGNGNGNVGNGNINTGNATGIGNGIGGNDNNNNNTNNNYQNNNRTNGGDPNLGRSSINTTTTEEVIGEIRRCAGCHRFEPLFASPTKHFIDVGDSHTGRCVCLACCRTVITTSDDVVPLWDKVIDFLEGPLGLITSEDSGNVRCGVTRRDLKNIPVVVVGMEALNDNMKRDSGGGGGGSGGGNAHFGSSQIMTRGLCLSEHTGGFGGNGGGNGGGCNDGVGVTAVLCLSGLPADLTASILAHEATHAWIKLHPNFPYTDPLPLKVEEGLCQLVAFLFLNDGLDPIEKEQPSQHSTTTSSGEESKNNSTDGNPSDEKLRQYFRFCIETDEGVYGEGFRLAARAYAKMGIQELLYYVAMNHDFPPL